MKFSPTKIISLIVLSLVVILTYSCNKDSDLLADYVIDENAGKPGNIIDLENGTFVTSEDKLIAINIRRDEQSSTDRIGFILQEVTQPENGKTEIQTDSTIIYTPDENFNGKDDFTYVVEEAGPDENTVQKENTIVVQVNPVLETKEDKVITDADKKAVVAVLKNDTYADKNTATIANTSTPAKGTVTINKDNTLTYTPNADASGEDTFTYTAEVKGTNNTVSKKEGKVTVDITAVETPEDITMGELLAFPGAVGFGQNTTGGRGGRIVEVTTLNFSGPGSLKEALEMKGARTIIFRVGGTIQNRGSDYLKIPPGSGDVTIAGQTAPGGGILIRGAMLSIRASNVIIRHMRFRQDPGTSTGSNNDAITVDGTQSGGGPLKNIILDHCSVSYGLDGNLDIRNTWGMTVQNSLISKNGKSNLINNNSKNISYLKNIFALVNERTVRANTISHLDLTYELINNFIYGVNYPGGGSQGLRYTVENNVCEASSEFSPASSNLVGFIASNISGGEPNRVENTYYYIAGNDLGDAYENAVKTSMPSEYRKSEPLYRSTYVPLPTTGLKTMLLANVGAYNGLPQGLDAVDAAIIKDIKSKSGKIASSGSFPTISKGTPYPDADDDGMDDTWELANGLDPKNSSDGKAISKNGGSYTNLEVFLHYLTIK